MKPSLAAAGARPAATSSGGAKGRIDTQLRSTSDSDTPETWVQVNALDSLEQAARFVLMLLVATSGAELRMLSLGDGRYRFRVTLPQPRVIELVLQSPEFFPDAMRRLPNGELEINLSPTGDEQERPGLVELNAPSTLAPVADVTEADADKISRLSSLFPGLTRLDVDLGDLLNLLTSEEEDPTPTSEFDQPEPVAPPIPDRVEALEPVLQGRIQIVAQPFSSFATLNRFIALVSALPDVQGAHLRRFRDGELRLAVDYDSEIPITSRLESIHEIPFAVQHDGGDLVELTMQEASAIGPGTDSHER